MRTPPPFASAEFSADHAPFAQKRAWLAQPGAYAEPTETVVVRETHMACVFLTDREVWKLKKPARYNSADYTTLAQRRAACEAEDVLNRRLAPDVYLGVGVLTREPDGRLAIGGGGQPVDYLVHMRRLPTGRMLDAALTGGTATPEDVDRVGELLAHFFADAPAERPPVGAYLERFAHDIAVNRAVLADPRFMLATDAPVRVIDRLDAAFATLRDALVARLSAGHVIEGHGDLRPEHVFLGPPPAIIDCLEFDRRLRLLDPFEELAFLTLECALLGGGWAGERIAARCAARRPCPSAALGDFYTAFRACLRARLCVAHLYDPQPREPASWLPKARVYLAHAAAALDRISPTTAR